MDLRGKIAREIRAVEGLLDDNFLVRDKYRHPTIELVTRIQQKMAQGVT